MYNLKQTIDYIIINSKNQVNVGTITPSQNSLVKLISNSQKGVDSIQEKVDIFIKSYESTISILRNYVLFGKRARVRKQQKMREKREKRKAKKQKRMKHPSGGSKYARKLKIRGEWVQENQRGYKITQ